MDSGTKSTDVEEFVSESYLASSKDIAEADESIKRLRVSGMTHEQNNSANLEFPLHKRQSINRLVKDHLIFDLDQRSRSWLVKIKITSKRSRSWQ